MLTPHPELLDVSGYEKVSLKQPDDIHSLEYAAGMMDTDGSIQLESTPSITITQAQKGFATLEYMYKTFGGRIAHHRAATETCQASYTWIVLGAEAVQLAGTASPI